MVGLDCISIGHGPVARTATRRLLLASLAGCLALSVPGPICLHFATSALADGGDSGGSGEGGEGGDGGSDGGGDSDGGDSDGGEGGGDSDGGEGGDGSDGGNSGSGSDGGEGGDGDSGGSNSGSGEGGDDDSGGSNSGKGGNSGKSGNKDRADDDDKDDDDGDINENGTDDEAERALELRESGKIKPLGQVYANAERRFKARVIGSRLVATPGEGSGWRYDLSVISSEGQVQQVSYDAGSGKLVAVDGAPAE